MQLPEDVEKNKLLKQNIKTEEQNENIKYILLPFLVTVVVGLGIILGYQWSKQPRGNRSITQTQKPYGQPTPSYSFTFLPTISITKPAEITKNMNVIASPEDIIIDNTEINTYLADLEQELQNL